MTVCFVVTMFGRVVLSSSLVVVLRAAWSPRQLPGACGFPLIEEFECVANVGDDCTDGHEATGVANTERWVYCADGLKCDRDK